MSNQRITFNPQVNVPYGVNLTIFPGSDFQANFSAYDINSGRFNFNSWSGSSQLAKSVSIGSSMYAQGTFNFSFTSASNGEFKIAMGSTETRNLKEGRYYYDVLVSSGTTVYKIVDGNILIRPGISSAP
tara:strand:+ start:87357 stop:87743 length:387 start_codon:yes stop_codon:yes gene_type:complete